MKTSTMTTAEIKNSTKFKAVVATFWIGFAVVIIILYQYFHTASVHASLPSGF